MKLLALFFTIFPLLASASVRLEFSATEKEYQQGSLVTGTLRINPENINQIKVQKFKGLTFGKSLYFYKIEPWLRTEGEQSFRSNVQVIFTNLPESNVLKETIDSLDLEINLNQVNILPTEASAQLIFGVFEIPSRPKIIFWALIGITLSAVLAGAYWGYKKYTQRQNRRSHKAKVFVEITTAHDYQSVVQLWLRKHEYLKTFPHMEEPFRKLESVLFKYQFKSSQTSQEKEEVLKAYQQFITEGQEGFRGN